MITVVNWPRERSLLTYRDNTCIPDKSKIEDLLKKEPDLGHLAVKVCVLDIDSMLSKKKNFAGLASQFQGLPNSFYASEYCQNLLEEFWVEN